MNPNDSLTTRPGALRRLRAGLIGGLCSLFLVLLAGQAWATPCDLDQDGDVALDRERGHGFSCCHRVSPDG